MINEAEENRHQNKQSINHVAINYQPHDSPTDSGNATNSLAMPSSPCATYQSSHAAKNIPKYILQSRRSIHRISFLTPAQARQGLDA
jgi:hypothetical protein